MNFRNVQSGWPVVHVFWWMYQQSIVDKLEFHRKIIKYCNSFINNMTSNQHQLSRLLISTCRCRLEQVWMRWAYLIQFLGSTF
jgi:hypothetical protein